MKFFRRFLSWQKICLKSKLFLLNNFNCTCGAGYKDRIWFAIRSYYFFLCWKWLPIRSNNFQIFPKMDDYKVPRVFCDSHFNQLPCEKSSLLPIYHEFSTFSWFFLFNNMKDDIEFHLLTNFKWFLYSRTFFKNSGCSVYQVRCHLSYC